MQDILKKFLQSSPSRYKFSETRLDVEVLRGTSISKEIPTLSESYVEVDSCLLKHTQDNSYLLYNYTPTGLGIIHYIPNKNLENCISIDNYLSTLPHQSFLSHGELSHEEFKKEMMTYIKRSKQPNPHLSYYIPRAYEIYHQDESLPEWYETFSPHKTNWTPVYEIYDNLISTFYTGADSITVNKSTPVFTPQEGSVIYLPNIKINTKEYKFEIQFTPFALDSAYIMEIKNCPEGFLSFLTLICEKHSNNKYNLTEEALKLLLSKLNKENYGK